MCLVEIAKMPKLQTACTTFISEGMVVTTQSDTVKQARKAMLEFVLCPRSSSRSEANSHIVATSRITLPGLVSRTIGALQLKCTKLVLFRAAHMRPFANL